MMEIEMPKISVEESEDKSYVKIVVEPLEKGFGITVGNCLRRTLLSALPGSATQRFAEFFNLIPIVVLIEFVAMSPNVEERTGLRR